MSLSSSTTHSKASVLAAVRLLLVSVARRANVDLCAGVDAWLWTFVVIESFARHNSVDFCKESAGSSQFPVPYLPVKMFWKASSTLLASRAEVSMKERLFSPAQSVSPILVFCQGFTYWQIV